MSAMRVAAAVIKVLCVGLVVSCAAGADPNLAQRDMVGLPKQRLLACAGAPDHRSVHSGREYLTYRRRGDGAIAPSASMADGGHSFVGVGLGIELDTSLVAGGGGGCVITVVLYAEMVEQVTYPVGARLSECAPIVQNCVERPSGSQ